MEVRLTTIVARAAVFVGNGLISNLLLGQQIVGLELHYVDCDSVNTSVSVFFPLGYGETCPDLQGTTISQEGGTTAIDLYYQVSGPWPQVGCITTDVIAPQLLTAADVVHLRTHAIMDGDTSFTVSDTMLTICMTGINDPVRGVGQAIWSDGDLVRWSTEGVVTAATVHIVALNGALQRSAPFTSGQLSIADLVPGVYVVSCAEEAGFRPMAFVVGAP